MRRVANSYCETQLTSRIVSWVALYSSRPTYAAVDVAQLKGVRLTLRAQKKDSMQ